jgi:hypothetical protein
MTPPRANPGLGGVLKAFPEILKHVTTVEAVLGLALLVILTGSVVIAWTGVASGAEPILWIFAGLVGLVLVACMVIYAKGSLASRRNGNPTTTGAPRDETPAEPDFDYEAYIAAPMEGLAPDTDFTPHNRQIIRIQDALRRECGIDPSFYAGSGIDGQDKFHQPFVALDMNLRALRASRRFILFYPQRLSSSIVFEAGLALALGKPSVWFIRDRADLPYLLKEADQASDRHGQRLPVKIIEYRTLTEILHALEVNKEGLFQID